jgi:proteasome lid subunit RPN8/RPN11
MDDSLDGNESQTTATELAPRRHRYAIEYRSEAGALLGALAIEPDFTPAREWTHFQGVRSGRMAVLTAAAEGDVSPIWSEERGSPYCSGVRVETRSQDGDGRVSSEFPMTYFEECAERGAREWVEKGKLRAGERYTWILSAYGLADEDRGSTALPANTIDPARAPVDFQVGVVADPIPLVPSLISQFRARSTRVGKTVDSDIPVFISESVIDQTCQLARKAGENETGGVLVGRLHKDASIDEAFVEIVAQIPAKHAEASKTRFSFTPDTWKSADAAIDLRGEDEMILGWWHSHPRYCNPACPEISRRACLFARPFFSSEDVHLHRVCFPQAYQVGLLISDLPEKGLTPALFGWRKGIVNERGYDTLPTQTSAQSEARHSTHCEGEENAKVATTH